MNELVKIKYNIYIESIFLLIFIFLPYFVNADFIVGNCSKVGYTIATINGINTTKKEAGDNLDEVKNKFGRIYKDEPVDFQFLYNPTHTLGIGDVFDTVDQGSFGKTNDVDLLNVQNDASTEIKTQKVLLVGHSQGNFYVNNLYDKIVDTNVPKKSIGAYAVATPAAYVAGVTRGTENRDNYVTSDNDKVINKYASIAMYSLPANIHIPVYNAYDSDGHNFLKIYMNYIPSTILRGITASLNKLQSNNIQDESKPCINPPQFSLLDTVQNKTLAVTDFALNVTVTVPVQKSLAFGNAVINGVDMATSLAFSKVSSLFGTSKNLALNTKASALDAVPQQSPNTIVVTNPQVISKPVPTTAPQKEIQPILPTTPQVPVSIPELPELADVPQPIAPVIVTIAPPQISFGGGGGGVFVGRGQGPSDTTPPVITINGNTSITVALNSVYTDQGATATDAFDGSVTVVSSGSVDTTTSGVYTITYTAHDSKNNTSTATRTVTVDNLVGPVITLTGANPLVLTRGDTFTDPGATALDAVDGSRTLTTTGTVDTAHGGAYTLTYSSTDASGNTTTATRTVKVNGKLIPFVNDTITSDLAYNGNYDAWFCMFDNATDRFLHNGASGAPIDMMRWQTSFQRKFNDNMTPLRNYRLIFGNNARAQDDCTNGTFYQDYSNPFYYTTKTGASIMYGTYTASGSSAKSITKFYLDMDFDPTVICQVDNSLYTIGCIVKQIVLTRTGFTLSSLIPHIAVSSGATIVPDTEVAQDFSSPFAYTVTAENGSTQVYTVTTTIDSVSSSANCTDPYVTCLPQ